MIRLPWGRCRERFATDKSTEEDEEGKREEATSPWTSRQEAVHSQKAPRAWFLTENAGLLTGKRTSHSPRAEGRQIWV